MLTYDEAYTWCHMVYVYWRMDIGTLSLARVETYVCWRMRGHTYVDIWHKYDDVCVSVPGDWLEGRHTNTDVWGDLRMLPYAIHMLTYEHWYLETVYGRDISMFRSEWRLDLTTSTFFFYNQTETDFVFGKNIFSFWIGRTNRIALFIRFSPQWHSLFYIPPTSHSILCNTIK